MSEAVEKELAKNILLLSCVVKRAELAQFINPVWAMLRVQRNQAALIDATRPSDQQDAARYQRAADLFQQERGTVGRLSKTSLLSRQMSSSNREWLLHIFDHGVHAHSFFSRESGQRTRETLEQLGWSANGRVTVAAPISQRELNSYRAIPRTGTLG